MKSYVAWRRLQKLGLLPEEWHDYEEFREALGDPPKRNARLRKRNAAMPHAPGNTYWGIVPSLSFAQRLRRNPKIADIARQQMLKSIRGARTRDEVIREIVAARLKGHTYQSIGIVAGMSRQSVFQIIRRYGGKHDQ
jgi:hypothetical protein